MKHAEIAHSVVQPHFDAVRDVFVGFAVEPGRHLDKLKQVRLVVDEGAHDSKRHFAATSESGRLIVVAPEIVDLPLETLVAIVTHEFGHAADFCYPACWTWPKAAAAKGAWVGEGAQARARAWRSAFGKERAVSRAPEDDRAPAENWAFAWNRRSPDQVEWAADGIAERVTGRRIGYAGDCMLQTFAAEPRPAGLR